MPPSTVRGLPQRVPIPWNLAGVLATRGRSDVSLRTCPLAIPSHHRSPTYAHCGDARANEGRASVAQPVSPARLVNVCKTAKPHPGAHPLLPLCRCPTRSSPPAFGPQPCRRRPPAHPPAQGAATPIISHGGIMLRGWLRPAAHPGT